MSQETIEFLKQVVEEFEYTLDMDNMELIRQCRKAASELEALVGIEGEKGE